MQLTRLLLKRSHILDPICNRKTSTSTGQLTERPPPVLQPSEPPEAAGASGQPAAAPRAHGALRRLPAAWHQPPPWPCLTCPAEALLWLQWLPPPAGSDVNVREVGAPCRHAGRCFTVLLMKGSGALGIFMHKSGTLGSLWGAAPEDALPPMTPLQLSLVKGVMNWSVHSPCAT